MKLLIRLVTRLFERMASGVDRKQFLKASLDVGKTLVAAGLIGLVVAGDSVLTHEAFLMFIVGFVLLFIGVRK